MYHLMDFTNTTGITLFAECGRCSAEGKLHTENVYYSTKTALLSFSFSFLILAKFLFTECYGKHSVNINMLTVDEGAESSL